MLKEMYARAKKCPKNIVFPEGNDNRVKKAIEIIKRKKIAIPLVLKTGTIQERLNEGMEMVAKDQADGLISGATHPTSWIILSAIKHIGLIPGIRKISGAFLMEINKRKFIFADCAVIPTPNPKELAEIAFLSANTFESLTKEKARVAMLSYSTNGSGKGKPVDIVKKAMEIVKKYPINVVGEIQADAAVIPEIAKRKGAKGKGNANVLIFPDLNSGNISYKLVQRLTNSKAIGPLLQGLKKPVNDLSRGSNAEEIVDVAAITCVQAQKKWKYSF
ncbi:MAG: phosphate acetyltransferase [Nanoarchaeota archaeon]|nr:phosphate acetyltransferase [Nanoarchaeota archaeon]MBU1445104.1 phosphate acetyltransferase [Nanoarchaeota archaeon]MBU2406368.1 phosphate acetyltransferase [Nanoarchaeota archaeon]MBU2420359.1 phosphate acetyltransferase [Nanoarchaeota archaeon]MBU2474967.1 phosphate acetyltransferase [Nanoarchaeota archaeon]